jgi:transposase-like protein
LGLFAAPLDGFSKEDFEVYNQACWSSNLHNLQRMKTKEKLLTLVKNVGKALGIEGTAISSSSEIPSVWNGRQVKEQLVYYSRDVVRQKQLQSVIAREFDLAERIKSGAEHERHLILFARIDAEHFTIGLRFTRFSLIDNRN